MEKSLILCLALAAIFTAQSFAVKAVPRAMLGVADNNTAAPSTMPAKANLNRQSKVVTTTLIDTIQNIRTILSSSARNMVCSPGATSADDTVQIAYLRGTGASYALWHAYSFDGGATWTNLLVDNVNRPRYPAAVVGDNDEGTSRYRPIHFAYHRQYNVPASQIYYGYESGSIGDGLYNIIPISDGNTAPLWIPSLNKTDSCLTIGATDYNTGNTWGAISFDLGQTWKQMGSLSLSGNSPIYLAHAQQESVFAFMQLNLSPLGDDQPCYWLSSDSGVTFAGPYPVVPETLMPQFTGSIWWYHYDAIMVNNVPHLTWVITDNGPNGGCIFHATLKVPGDYSQGWKIVKVSDVEDPITGLGTYPGDPSIGSDAAGNLYISYNDWSISTSTSGIRMVASTDGGDNWTVPYVVVPQNAAYDLYPQEMAREVGADAHIVSCDMIQTPDAGGLGPLYHYSVPVIEVLATGIASQVNVPTIYTEGKLMGTGDTILTPLSDSLYFSWSTGFGYGGEYNLRISQDSTFVSAYGFNFEDNEFSTIGLSSLGKWFWKIRATLGGETSSWSDTYSFSYYGTMGEWPAGWPPGVAGQPQEKQPVYSFALSQSMPNPVKGNAEISFNLPKAGNYNITIYNILGQPVNVLEGKGNAGVNKVAWNSCDKNGNKVSNGIYLYTLKALGNTATKKLVVMR